MPQQHYLVLKLNEENPDDITVCLSNYTPDKNNIYDSQALVSAGTVRFIKGIVVVEAEVTHGSIALGIPVNLDRAVIDKKLIEKLFT